MSVRLPDHVDEAAFNHGERVDEGGDGCGDGCEEGEIRYARRERLVGMQRCRCADNWNDYLFRIVNSNDHNI